MNERSSSSPQADQSNPHGVRTSQPLSRTGTRAGTGRRDCVGTLRRQRSRRPAPSDVRDEANYPTATIAQFPGEDGVVEYTEGRLVGYRYFEATEHDAVYPFGHGYSYAEFAYRDAERMDDSTVRVTVENTSSGRAVRSCRRTCVQLEESARLMARCGNSLGSRPLRIPAGVWVESILTSMSKRSLDTVMMVGRRLGAVCRRCGTLRDRPSNQRGSQTRLTTDVSRRPRSREIVVGGYHQIISSGNE